MCLLHAHNKSLDRLTGFSNNTNRDRVFWEGFVFDVSLFDPVIQSFAPNQYNSSAMWFACYSPYMVRWQIDVCSHTETETSEAESTFILKLSY